MSFADPFEPPDPYEGCVEPPDNDDDEPREAPDFGCACENPLFVDTTCDGCIEIMKALDASAEEARPTPPPPTNQEVSREADDLEVPF